jgi:hypothetical protein
MLNKEVILGLVRHLLTFGGGYIVAANLADANMVSEGVGAVMTILGIVWSAYDKHKAVA